jgi:hypothetical protein
LGVTGGLWSPVRIEKTALYYDLKVFNDEYRLILKIFEHTENFPREYKYTLGQDMKLDGIMLVSGRRRGDISGAYAGRQSRLRCVRGIAGARVKWRPFAEQTARASNKTAARRAARGPERIDFCRNVTFNDRKIVCS